jgi:hypothetical protein
MRPSSAWPFLRLLLIGLGVLGVAVVVATVR